MKMMFKNVIFEWLPKENNLLGLSLNKVYTLKINEDEFEENIVSEIGGLKDIEKEDLRMGTIISLGVVIFKVSIIIYE